MAERDLPYEVPELEYVDLQAHLESLYLMGSDPNNWWGNQTPITTCVRCGRYTEDPNRNVVGEPMHEDPKDDLEPRCEDCAKEAFGEALEKDLLDFLERRLGLEERHRDALRSFIETIFTDPQKILQVKDLNNRVRELEKQNGRLWVALGIEGGLIAVLIASVIAIAPALAS